MLMYCDYMQTCRDVENDDYGSFCGILTMSVLVENLINVEKVVEFQLLY